MAYLRGLPGSTAQKARFAKPADVKRWIEKLARPVQVGGDKKNNLNGLAPLKWPTVPPTVGDEIVSMVWNGQVGDHSCLLDDSVEECPTLDINDDTPVGGDPACNAPGTGSGSVARRRDEAAVNGTLDDDDSVFFNGTVKDSMELFGRAAACPINQRGPTKTVSIRSGSPSPTCSGDHCGKLCKGFFCNLSTLSPGVHPPDFTQPQTKKPDPTTKPSTTDVTTGDPPPITLPDLPDLPTSTGWFPTSPSGGTCVSSATLTSVGGPGGGGGQATLTSSGCMSYTTSKKPEPTVDPPQATEYPYTWYIYATVDDNFVTGSQQASGYLIFDSPPR